MSQYDDDGPERQPSSGLRLVSRRSEQEIKGQAATWALRSSLLNLAANIIRVVRGAGNPNDIIEQIRAVETAYADWGVIDQPVARNLFGELLALGPPPDRRELGHSAEAAMADYNICRAALQVVASTLVGQALQRDNALKELHAQIDSQFTRRARTDKAIRRTEKRARMVLRDGSEP